MDKIINFQGKYDEESCHQYCASLLEGHQWCENSNKNEGFYFVNLTN